MAHKKELKAPATIKDVAKLAGVSFKTASRVVNREGKVSTGKVEAVEQAARSLSYTPNLLARQLRTQRPNLIAFVVEQPSSYIASLQFAMIQVCAELELNLVVEAVSPGGESRSAQRVRRLRVHGAVLASPLDVNYTLQERLYAAGVPYVLLSPMQAGVAGATVGMDDFGAAKAMTELVIANGHRRIGFIAGPPTNPVSLQRRLGYLAALKAHGISSAKGLERQAETFNFESGFEVARQLLKINERPTAIFASNDNLALATLRVAAKMGLSVPAELSVVGFDDVPAAAMAQPGLTTVRQPLDEIGRQAIGLLVSNARPHYQHIGLGFELVERESLALRS